MNSLRLEIGRKTEDLSVTICLISHRVYRVLLGSCHYFANVLCSKIMMLSDGAWRVSPACYSLNLPRPCSLGLSHQQLPLAFASDASAWSSLRVDHVSPLHSLALSQASFSQGWLFCCPGASSASFVNHQYSPVFLSFRAPHSLCSYTFSNGLTY